MIAFTQILSVGGILKNEIFSNFEKHTCFYVFILYYIRYINKLNCILYFSLSLLLFIYLLININIKLVDFHYNRCTIC